MHDFHFSFFRNASIVRESSIEENEELTDLQQPACHRRISSSRCNSKASSNQAALVPPDSNKAGLQCAAPVHRWDSATDLKSFRPVSSFSSSPLIVHSCAAAREFVAPFPLLPSVPPFHSVHTIFRFSSFVALFECVKSVLAMHE